MRRYIILAILCGAFASCSDDAPALLTPDLVSDMKAYDLDNNGNASDIRVDFLVENNLNVSEYRVMVLPASVSNSLDAGIAESLARESFVVVFPENFEDKYSINRLTSDLLDVNGALIGDGISYVVVVLIVGTGNSQLSEFSNPFTLKDQGIYDGRYLVSAVAKCVLTDGSPFEDIVPLGDFFIDFRAQGNTYSGTITCNPAVCNGTRGIISFNVVGATITDYTWNSPQTCPASVAALGLCNEGDPCPILETGQGTITNELAIEALTTGMDCYSTCETTWLLVRQT